MVNGHRCCPGRWVWVRVYLLLSWQMLVWHSTFTVLASEKNVPRAKNGKVCGNSVDQGCSLSLLPLFNISGRRTFGLFHVPPVSPPLLTRNALAGSCPRAASRAACKPVNK